MKCLAILAALSACATQAPVCLLPTQRPMLMMDLYFGRGAVTDAQWAEFTRAQITPRFPDGFSIIEARGQWLNPRTNTIGSENSKILRIAAQQDPGTAAKILALTNAYRTQFHQIAVGITTNQVCAAF
jgi:hypothetical protein